MKNEIDLIAANELTKRARIIEIKRNAANIEIERLQGIEIVNPML